MTFTWENVNITHMSWGGRGQNPAERGQHINTIIRRSPQTTVGKAMARCVRRPWSSSTACSSWSRHGSRFPLSRVCCRPAWTCGLSATRSTASWWSRRATRLPRTLPHTSATGSSSPAWAAPSCLGPLCSSTCDSTSRGEIIVCWTDLRAGISLMEN